MEGGILYICPTPIGNLEDITIRTLNILNEVDLIAAEDTRRTLKLLNHYEIKKPLTSYHEHNKKAKGSKLIDTLKEGNSIALVSDAGMPGISDPGADIIRECIEEDIEVIVLPGASASIVALVGSGLNTDKFVFEGFLSSVKKDRRRELEKLVYEKRTLIFYESPYRIKDTLKDIIDIFGNRKVALNRELTKKFEEIIRKDAKAALDILEEREIKGEFVLIVEGSSEEEEKEEIDIEKELKKYIDQGISKSKSVKMVSKEFDIAKNEVYEVSLIIE